MDLCHAPLFALLAGMFFGTVRSRPTQKPVWVWGLGIWGGLSAFGLFAEWLQNFVGRHPSWHDAIANSLGAAAGVLSMWPDAARRRGRLFRGIAVLLLLFAWATPFWILADAAYQAWQMPVLASFEWPGELSRWAVQDCQLQRVKKHQTAGDWALQVDLKAGIYPGLEMPEVPPGWTGYRELAFDVTLESPQSLSLIVKIYDEAHNLETEDRFHYRAELTAGLNRIRIPLSEVQHAPEGV